eukprot:TRINITY_DN1810_c0_g4_i1.p1 TRINITY_DN1810_c0_g4~~TRINITY_DN1810_c0_g4_i1.p1  ORF type:complete len:489 (+),score=95.94 TRINITY_DN1810_c0_g4_i1:150-1469(+)
MKTILGDCANLKHACCCPSSSKSKSSGSFANLSKIGDWCLIVFVIVLIGGGYTICSLCVIIPWYNWFFGTIPGVLVLLIAHIFYILLLWSYGKAVTCGPGWADSSWIPEGITSAEIEEAKRRAEQEWQEKEARKKAKAATKMVSPIPLLPLLVGREKSDPQQPKENTSVQPERFEAAEEHRIEISPSVSIETSESSSLLPLPASTRSQHRWCVRCQIFKPVKAHHCSECNRCVRNMDHHCPWINNCVGEKNHKSFILFLNYATICITFLIIIISFRFYEIVGIISSKGSITGSENGTQFVKKLASAQELKLLVEMILILVVYIIYIPLDLAIGGMYCLQISLILRSTTSIEKIIGKSRSSTPPSGEERKESQASDLESGLGHSDESRLKIIEQEPKPRRALDCSSGLKNLQEIMGPSSYFWWLPIDYPFPSPVEKNINV